MQYLVNRLTAAASSPKIRRDMNVEDEYFSALENRDTKIMMQDKLLKQKEQQLEQKNILVKNMAKALLDKGMSISDIAMMTGMSEAYIKKL